MRRAYATRGTTLPELMIAMSLFALVLAGLMSMLLTAGQTQLRTSRTDGAQTSVRLAIERITRDVQLSAAGAPAAMLLADQGPPQRLSLVVTNSSTGPDRLDLIVVQPQSRATLMVGFSPGQQSLSVDSAAAFMVGDRIQAGGRTVASLLSVTGIDTSAALPALLITPPQNPLPPLPPGCTVFRAHGVSYFIDTGTFGPLDPVLMMDPDGPDGPLAPQPLVEGVEDFQVALGLDLDGDGVLRSVGAAPNDDEWVFNVPGETAPASLAALRAVRVTVVSRLADPGGGAIGLSPPSAAEDHISTAPPDRYFRRVTHSVITVRNLNP